MTLYVLLVLIVVIVAVIYLARRSWRASRPSKVDLPLWEEQEPLAQRELEFGPPEDDTTPAVLSPPEWERPKPGSDDPRR